MVKVGGWSLPNSRRDEPPYFSKTQLVDVLEQVAVLLELSGANGFKVRAYQNASRALSSMEEDLFSIISEGRLLQVKGIGKGIGGLITESVLHGTWGDMQSLYDKVPTGLIEIVGIPGLGPKKVKALYDSLGIESIEQLKTACELDHISSLPGFGKKSQKKIFDGIDLLRRYQGRTRMDVGLLFGRSLEEKISLIEGVEKAQLAGSARRRRETIGDLDIVVSSLAINHQKVIQEILGLPGIAEVKGYGDSKTVSYTHLTLPTKA